MAMVVVTLQPGAEITELNTWASTRGAANASIGASRNFLTTMESKEDD
jgi:hypothetical protein